MKRIGAVIVGLLCAAVTAIHATDGNQDLSVDPPSGETIKPIQFVAVVGGKFMMGRNDFGSRYTPVHQVTIKDFDISDTLVTVEQYAECVLKDHQCAEPGTEENCNWGKKERQRQPVNCLSWKDANDFAKFKEARLLSEAEYEYVTKCDERESLLCRKPAGDVWEWTADTWHDSYADAPTDGSAWQGTGSYRVVRSDLRRVAGFLQGDNRYNDLVPGYPNINVGFRLARSRR